MPWPKVILYIKMNKITLLGQWLENKVQNNDNNETINLDFAKICRICLTETTLLCDLQQIVKLEHLFNIDEDLPLKDIINIFLEVKINKDDYLPQQICSECTENAWTSYKFKKQCEKSDSILQLYLKVMSNLNTPIAENSLSTTNIVDDENNSEIHMGQSEIPNMIIGIKIDEVDDMVKYPEVIRNESIDFEYADETTTVKAESFNKEILAQCDAESEKPKKCDNSTKDETTQPIYACNQCTACFLKKMDLTKHIKQKHKNNKEYVCKECNQTFSQAQTLARHTKIHQVDQKNKLCTFCGKCFTRSDDLKRHTRIHTGERPYSCDQCPKKYKQTSELKEHQKSHSKEKHYMCTVCGKSLATRNGLYVHMKAHRGEKNHECKICGNKYVTSGELTSHIKHIHSKQKPFNCTYDGCTRAFVTKISLRTHLQAHAGEKPYKCAICKKGLATSSSLLEHKRTHTGFKPKQCAVCQRRLGNSQALKKHMRIHTGERPYQCKICMENFICGSSLSTHIKIRHQEKQHECDICGKKFALATKLRQHMKVHSSDKTFCPICSVYLPIDVNFQEHLAKHDVVWV